jgi:hypothetical protein
MPTGVAEQLPQLLLQHYEHNCSQLQHSVMILTAVSLLKVNVSGSEPRLVLNYVHVRALAS